METKTVTLTGEQWEKIHTVLVGEHATGIDLGHDDEELKTILDEIAKQVGLE